MKSLLLSFFLCFAGISIYAQNYEIKGTVSDASGMPLPGVSIVVKNTTKGSSSDFDGKFTLSNVQKGETVVFSFVGYTTKQIVINNSNDLNIILAEDTQSLDEVVVVGYGTQKKSVVTGAISGVKSKDLENIPSGRVEQTLQGRVSGVTIAANSGQPGSSSTVRVRGLTTFDTYGGNNPLWVVDGVIIDSGAIGFVNQSDIESVEVLKDAASLAIYGARAASGVIMITTKKGKSGKISVNYTGFTGVSAPEKSLKLLNATQYGALMNEKSVAAGGNIVYPNLAALGLGTDWQKAIFNDDSKRSSHEISLTGGNDVSNFFVSFGLQDTEGIVSKEISNFNKKNIRLNSSHKLSDMFRVGQTLGYSHQVGIGLGNTNSEFGGPLSSAINLDPTTPIVVTDPVAANSTLYTSNPVFRDVNGNPYGISSVVGQEMSNPVGYINSRLGNYNWSDDFVGNVFVEISPIENLKFKSSVGGKLAFWGYESFTPKYFLSPTVFASQNSLSRGTNKAFGWNIENTISYSKQIADHNFTILLGQGTYIDNISSGAFVTYTNLPVNNYQDASFSFSLPQAQIAGSAYTGQEHRVTSLFSRLNYDYKEKYLFTGIIRRDGSSNFGPNNKFGMFPSFSAGWVISKEDFWKDNSIVNTIKLRGGYGVTGNDAIPPNGYLALIGGGRNYTFGDTGTVITVGNSPNAPSNPDLKWEETSQINIGIDAKLFNDFNLTVEYYNKETSGILQFYDLPGYVGSTGSPLGNVADMSNTGIEVELGFRKQFGDFNFSGNGNVSYLKNEVTFLGQGKEFITSGAAGFQSMGSITRTQVGEAYNSFYGFKTAGIFQTVEEIAAYTNSAGTIIQPNARPGDFRWIDTDDNGTITDLDKQFLGSPLPKFTFGLTLNLDYKGFDFMVFAQGATGNKIFQGLRRLDILNANYQTDALSRWTGPGTSNTYPRLTNNDTNGNFGKSSDFYLENGDYLRFKVLQLGYTLPSDLISKIGAQKLRVYITGENLLTLTKYTGYDPEIGGNVLGIDRGYYPQAQSFMIGANIQF
ncbi:TonB-dependent receptor [Lutibacter sp.]|uniref:SusC/RagA family TonB-linked outer membrane protein n=1 Tax=Lutibacter sp. TaxID=1925666 RepID=UPI0027332515|nr:TonB-dependent receptor [Lutibacter sp.]MDP3313571.1 TonB-dependent receptor [Lutibacter sp.]